jgi:manganese/zinc/iron transport system ATP- binding protein
MPKSPPSSPSTRPFATGAMTAIIGPNGAGKSTLLKACLGIVPRLSGEVDVFGQPVERARAQDRLCPAAGQRRLGLPGDGARRGEDGALPDHRPVRAADRRAGDPCAACLDRVGMADFADRQIGQLSGGQQQRVFLARALAQDADLYLLDEPFAGVDAATERAIVDVLKA